MNEKVQKFYSNFPQLNFEYKNPEQNFDRNRVKGLVCNLFKIKDAKYATALETAAGGKVRYSSFYSKFGFNSSSI